MWLTRIVLAVLPIVAPSVMAVSEPHEADLYSRIDVIPMAWRVDRKDDAASGDRSCFLISWGGDVIVRLHKPRQATAATWSVMIGADSQPGSVRYLRINRKYFTTAEQGFRGAEADEIVQLLKSPGEFAFEWAKWPDHSKQGGLFGTGNFAAKAAECERWVDQDRSVRATPPRSKGRPDGLEDMPPTHAAKQAPRAAAPALDQLMIGDLSQRLSRCKQKHIRRLIIPTDERGQFTPQLA